MQNKYNLGVCEIYDENIHGFTENSYPYIHTHFILIFNIDINNIYRSYSHILARYSIIKNYHKIISNINNLKINIIETIELPTK